MSSVSFRHIVCAIILLLSLPWPAFSESSKQVLILNSYHHGFKWTDEQSSSVITELGNSGIPIKYYIEYMSLLIYQTLLTVST